VDVGTGAPAMFVHGIGTNAYLWSGVVGALTDVRRCIAVDLPLHGQSPARLDQRMTIGAFADVLAELCEGLDLAEMDLVAPRHWRRDRPDLRRPMPRATAISHAHQLRHT
jgi:pimeloyl-ACP methyl ester carboxylesterase